ncbi:hypothetical protein J0H58_07780 [bacterium]|nr:hypothetical protein [bacterium]
MSKVIQVERQRTGRTGEQLRATFIGRRQYDQLVAGEETTVLKPDGSPLLIYKPRAIPDEVCSGAFQALLRVATPTDNRGDAAGGRYPAPGGAEGEARGTTRAEPVLSGVAGYFGRQGGRHPHCRVTAFTARDVGGWARVVPLVQAADRVFRAECPDRYDVQLAAARATPPYYVIDGTAFTTLTVNRNFRTAVHRDAEDLPEGFGVMTVLEAGEYRGGHLVFPDYRVAVDVRDGDVLLADVHEWHGNAPIVGREGEYERVSCVMYYRAKMRDCRPAAEEYARRVSR